MPAISTPSPLQQLLLPCMYALTFRRPNPTRVCRRVAKTLQLPDKLPENTEEELSFMVWKLPWNEWKKLSWQVWSKRVCYPG